jgi:hypothetical protein
VRKLLELASHGMGLQLTRGLGRPGRGNRFQPGFRMNRSAFIGHREVLSFLLVECITHRPGDSRLNHHDFPARGPGGEDHEGGRGNGEDAASDQQILPAGVVEFA